jgi:tripartite-type tricarboxylate transporter receptor subunit TctC
VIDKLNATIEKILREPDVREKFAKLGVEPVGGPPEAFSRHIRGESEKWGRVVRTANIKLN